MFFLLNFEYFDICIWRPIETIPIPTIKCGNLFFWSFESNAWMLSVEKSCFQWFDSYSNIFADKTVLYFNKFYYRS